MPLLVVALVAVTALGRGDVVNHLRFGFAHLFSAPF